MFMSMKIESETLSAPTVLRALYVRYVATERGGQEDLARAMDYKDASGIQRYFRDDWSKRKKHFPPELVAKFEKAMVGKGNPIITKEEVWKMATPYPVNIKESGNSKNSNIPQSFHIPQRGNNPFPLNDYDLIPMYGAVSASSPEIVHFTEDYMIEEVPRHPSVQKVKGAFAMQVQGDSMAPRHFPGERVYINPHQVPHVGQDCVIVYEQDGNAILKQFRGETAAEWKFYQLNPASEFTIEKKQVRKIYAVVR